MKKFLLITIGLSISLWADFSRSGEIVTDNETELQWQDNSEAKTKRLSWQNAIEYCDGLELGGYTDWILPNINELTSIVDDTRYDLSIDNAFINVASDLYWSSTTNASYSHYAWLVGFSNGRQDGYSKNNSLYVRCVRAGQP